MNLVISQIATDYMDDWLSDLLDELIIEQCVIVYVDRENVKKGKVCRQYATVVIDWEQCISADYEILKTNKIPPIDDEILNAMAPYEDVIFWMLRRRQGREFERYWRHYCIQVRVWNYILDSLNIDVYISTRTPHEGYDFIIYALCKVKGIHYCASQDAHFPGYSYLANDIFIPLMGFDDYVKDLQNKYKDFSIESIQLSKEIDAFYQKYYGENDLTPWYMVERMKKTSIFSECKERIQYFFRKKDAVKKMFKLQTYKKTISAVYHSKYFRRLQILCNRGKLISWEILHLFSLNVDVHKFIANQISNSDIFREYEILLQYYKDNANPVDYSKKYIYVALHNQPESTSSPRGGRFVDQILMVQMLSYYLPDGYCLYVKEHPSQIRTERIYSFRTLDFYNRLLEIPKVFLVPLEENTYRLIDGACAIAALTGTVGFEAIIKNKLFFMFGYFLTQYAPNVIPIRSSKDCMEAMQRMESYNQDEETSRKQIKIYFKALEKIMYRGRDLDEPIFKSILPDDYWAESKKIMVDVFRNRLIEFMGESILKRI